MAMNVKDLCRLCGKKDEFAKDLMDDSNKSVLKIIHEFMQIMISNSDNMPTKVCLNCEERIVSFQLFILECYNVQETLRDVCLLHNENIPIKLEAEIMSLRIENIKAEVKNELTAEDIVSAINNEASVSEYVTNNCNVVGHNMDDDTIDDHNNDIKSDDDHNNDDDDYDSDVSDVNLALLKESKKKYSRQEISEEHAVQLEKILKEPNVKAKDLVKLQCHICEQAINTWKGLRIHYSKRHRAKPVLFCTCGFIITSRTMLYKHVAQHKAESKTLQNREDAENIRDPNFKIHDFVDFLCSFCDKQFQSWYSLKSHSESRHKVKPTVKCICGAVIKSKTSLYKHVQDHKNPNVLTCDKCPRIAKSLAAYNKHILRHVPKSERQFKCSSCDKIFNSKDALKSHIKSHIPIEERKIYRCDVCDLKFTTRSSAAAHKRVVHEKIKSYVCDQCGYACGTNGELRQHRAIHSDDKPFVCKKCSKSFKTYSNLKTHMDTHEDTSYACYVCNRVLNSRRTLRKHLLVHEDKCRHVCSYCNKAFKRRQTLKVHMYTHTGHKPLTCKWCNERFAYASTLRSHRLRYHPDHMAAAPHYAHYSEQDNIDEDYSNDNVETSDPSKNEIGAM